MNTTTDASHAIAGSRISSRGAIAAAVIGNWLEFFDLCGGVRRGVVDRGLAAERDRE